RLIGPVVELVVAEQAYVRHEYAGIYVDAVQLLEVISTVCFRDVPVGVIQLPLTAGGAGIVARSRLRVHPELSHQSSANIVVVEVSADTNLRYLHLVRSEDFARSSDRVIRRMMKRIVIGGIESYFGGEDLRVDRRLFCAGITRQPCEVGKRKWFLLSGGLCRFGL